MAMPAMPGAAFVVIKAELVLGGFEAVLDGLARPSTDTSFCMEVPLGHQLEKKAKLP